MNIRLELMTPELMREFFRDFTSDPDTFEGSGYSQYIYRQEHADAFYKKHDRPDRLHFAVMGDQEIIGDLYFKNISKESKCCTLSIHLKNDAVKNQGYGTIAEQLALRYAFLALEMEHVYADALIKNKRSRHVLQKVGFVERYRDNTFCYYECSKQDWMVAEGLDKVPLDKGSVDQ